MREYVPKANSQLVLIEAGRFRHRLYELLKMFAGIFQLVKQKPPGDGMIIWVNHAFPRRPKRT